MLADSEQLASVEPERTVRPRLEELFARQRIATPDADALLWRGATFSFAQLDERANRIANRLLALGYGAGTRVAIAMPRSADLVASVLACLKVGCVYVPIDTGYPADRAAFMLRDCRARAVLVGVSGAMPECAIPVIACNDPGVLAASPALPRQSLAPDAPAYILYTSGSSGRPKGVLLGHDAAGYILGSIRHFADGELARVAAVTSISFDPSVFEIFAPLASGGTIILKDDALSPFAADERPTLLQGVPSVLRQLARAGAIPNSVRVINSGGETLTRDIADELYARTAIERLYNHYGPTEASICTTIAAVARDEGGDPDAGRPVAGARLHLRDAEGDPVAEGEVGEILIGGPVLAHGYVGDPALTAGSFGFDEHAGERVYRTGDQGRISPAGRLELLGRMDEQIKLRGHRIELAEVDDALAAAPGVGDAGAVVMAQEAGAGLLIGFVTAEGQGTGAEGGLDLRNIAASVRTRLPPSMIPHRIEHADAIPRLPNGKIDRRSLAHRWTALANPQDKVGDVRPGSPASDNEGLVDIACTLFAQALSRSGFDPDEDFFEAGGDSLMGVDIALAFEPVLNRPVPANTLSHHATPRAFVDALRRHRRGAELLTREGDPAGQPIFFAPGIRGSDVDYDSMKLCLPQHALMLLHSAPLKAQIVDRPRIETIARGLVDTVAEAQPEGTVTLLGFSFGGQVAYGLARELEARGRRTRLVLVDPRLCRTTFSPSRWTRWARRKLWPFVRSHGAVYAARRLGHAMMFWFPKSLGWLRPGYLPEFLRGEDLELVSGLVKAEATFRAPSRNGPTLLFLAEQAHSTDLFANPDGLNGWRGMLGERTVIERVDAMHTELIRRPVLNKVCAAIDRWLAGTEQAGAGPAASQSAQQD